MFGFDVGNQLMAQLDHFEVVVVGLHLVLDCLLRADLHEGAYRLELASSSAQLLTNFAEDLGHLLRMLTDFDR